MLDDVKYETLANIEWRYESYEYDQTEIYRRVSDGALFHASDSGCSCPMPFEDVTEADMKPIRTMQDFNDLIETGLSQSAREDVNRAREIVKQTLKEWSK